MRIVFLHQGDQTTDRLQKAFKNQGLKVFSTSDFEEAVYSASTYACDAIILDIPIPEMRSRDAIQRIKQDCRAPLMVLKPLIACDAAQLFDADADQVSNRWERPGVLIASLYALIRRAYGLTSNIVTFGLENEGKINLTDRAIKYEGQRIEITAHGYNVVEMLALNAGAFLNHFQLANHIYEDGEGPESNSVESVISYARDAFRSVTDKNVIRSERRMGFIIDTADSRPSQMASGQAPVVEAAPAPRLQYA